ncbi:halo transducer protein [Halobaculum lipolyticum]|uniref:Halo transducer protein n=1 Tax=Halobaculum lipolyticum TaxID=3032001 RepID=A0ABD5WBA2_9EURY|nr:halo transducer protein [Halobaculum sp. DT31]
MSEPEDDANGAGLVGLSVEEAAAVVAEREGVDPERARGTLSTVAEDGTVTESGVQSALAHLAKVVSTPATRVEFAGLDVDDAREAAADVADVPAVAARLDDFEARLRRIEADVEALDADLRRLVDRAGDPDGPATTEDVYAVAREADRVGSEANELQAAADELGMDAEEFERWVASPSARHDELDADVDELAGAVARLESDAAALGDEPDAETWFDCTLRRRVLALQVADLRAEVDDLETVADRLGDDPDTVEPRLAAAATDLDDVDDRLATVADELAAAAREPWHDRYDDRLAAFEATVDDADPPVDWGGVLTALETALAADN